LAELAANIRLHERALRVVALGRKNFLFAGSDGGEESAAAMYSPIGTAKLNGIDPESFKTAFS
jgi:transposase